MIETGQETENLYKKVNKRAVNVIENKGPIWKTRRQSENLYENKHTYSS